MYPIFKRTFQTVPMSVCYKWEGGDLIHRQHVLCFSEVSVMVGLKFSTPGKEEAGKEARKLYLGRLELRVRDQKRKQLEKRMAQKSCCKPEKRAKQEDKGRC